MSRIETILVPTDFSGTAAEALAYARALADRTRGRIVLVTVIDKQYLSGAADPLLQGAGGVSTEWFSQLGDEASRRIENLVSELRASGLSAEGRITEGDPAEMIELAADELHADVIVMGTHSRTGVSRLLLGSVTDRVTRVARCPVLAVPPHSYTDEAGVPKTDEPFERILFATDFSSGADPALTTTRELATALRSEVILTHAWEPPEMAYGGYPGAEFPPLPMPRKNIDKVQADLRFKLEQLAKDIESLGVRARYELLDTRPDRGVVELADRLGASLIVVGTHGRRGLNRLILGSVASRILRQASIPVLVVPEHMRKAQAAA